MRKFFIALLISSAAFTSQIIAQHRNTISHSTSSCWPRCDIEMGCNDCSSSVLLISESIVCPGSTAAASSIVAASYWGLPLNITIPTLGVTSFFCLITGLCLAKNIASRMPNIPDNPSDLNIDENETEEEFV